MLRGVIAAIAITIATPNIGHTQNSANGGQKAILVTGASSGIGRKLTERLAADGYFVYATARKEADLQALATIKNVQGVRLDVTHPDDIAAAVETVTKGGRGLYALVNNAGIASASPLLNTSPEEFASMMAVNVTGPYLMSRAFAPLIVATNGRIVNIGSISGLLSEANIGPYQMSKAALETFTDVLARELSSSGVQVSIVEPGSYNSDILKNAVTRAGLNADIADRSKLKEPDEVVVATEAALFEPRPKRRYMVVPNAGSAEVTIRAQVEKLVQVNEGQPYTYDRAALIKMLDTALAGARPMQPLSGERAAADDPVLGTWKLNVEKSKFVPGPGWQSQIRVYQSMPGGISVTWTGISANGGKMEVSYTYQYDGKDYPMAGSESYDTLNAVRIDALTVKSEEKRDGKTVGIAMRSVSPDGKVLTITDEGMNRKGQKFSQVLVFDRQ